jgi:hypothetical protein
VIVAREPELLADDHSLREEIDEVFRLIGGLFKSLRDAPGE